MHGEGLARVLVPRAHGEAVDGRVEELDGAVARRHECLVLVQLGPRHVVERVLRVEPGV